MPTVQPIAKLGQADLETPSASIIRNTLGGIASTPRRRTTLIAIQGMTIFFTFGVFGHLIFRRDRRDDGSGTTEE